jgi:hypothetical protein
MSTFDRSIRLMIFTTTGVAFLLGFWLTHGVGRAAESNFLPLPYPRVSPNSWVMIEFWADVSTITLSAYFLDSSYGKNKNLCNAAKAVFDRDQKEQSQRSKKAFSSYRLCLSLNDAVQQGHVERAR